VRGVTKEECGGKVAELGERLFGEDVPYQAGLDVTMLCSFFRQPRPNELLEPVFLRPGSKIKIVKGNGIFQEFVEGDVFEAIESREKDSTAGPGRTIKLKEVGSNFLTTISDFKGVTVEVMEVPS
jgi:hypothetical protein